MLKIYCYAYMEFSKNMSRKGHSVYFYFEIVAKAGPGHNLDFGSIYQEEVAQAWEQFLI